MDIKEIEPPVNLSSEVQHRVIITRSITPSRIIQMCNSDEFEEIVAEWAYSYLREKYEKISHIGGTGDKGRDIIAYVDYKKNVWENYQCKHYDHKLSPADIWLEIGKLCYFCFNKEFQTPPQKYFFVSPLGVSSETNDILRNAARIKDSLIKNWDKSCKNKIIQNKSINLEDRLKEYVEKFDFSIFDYLPPEQFIEQYSKTNYYATRFGILTKSRPLQKPKPQEIMAHESTYIRKILEAYSDYLKVNVENHNALDKYPELKRNFERQRHYFFCAETLNEFSRDISAPEQRAFENLKKELYDGIIETIEDDAENGFIRLKKVLDRATQLQITNNPLVSSLYANDRKGICHHLANERTDVVWKK